MVVDYCSSLFSIWYLDSKLSTCCPRTVSPDHNKVSQVATCQGKSKKIFHPIGPTTLIYKVPMVVVSYQNFSDYLKCLAILNQETKNKFSH